MEARAGSDPTAAEPRTTSNGERRLEPGPGSRIEGPAQADAAIAPSSDVTHGITPPSRHPVPGDRIRPPTPRVALLIAAAIVVGVVVYAGREAIAPFIVGLLLVYLVDPLVERVARTRLPRWAAILVVYAVVAFVVVEILTLTLRPLVEQVIAFTTDLPSFVSALDQQLQRISEIYRGLELPPALRQSIDEALANLATDGAQLDPGLLLPVFNVTAGVVSSIFGYLIIPVWAFYLLKDRRALVSAFDRSLPPEWRTDVWNLVRIVGRVFGQWVRGQLVLGLSVGVATFIGLLVLGATIDPVFSRFALLLAIIAGVFELLPIIGPILSAIPAVLIAATAGLEAAVAAVVLYLLIQQVENNVLVPKIQGDAVELHPSVVMFALVMGGAIYGLLGAILALPITAAARDVFRYLFARSSPEAAPATASPAEVRAGAAEAHAPPALEPTAGPARDA